MVGMRFARAALSDLEARKMLGPPDDLGWQKILSPSSEKQKNQSRREHDGSPVYTRDIDSLSRQIAELQARVDRLLESGRTIIAQREEWKARALAAESRYQQGYNGSVTAQDTRFAKLKSALMMEFHPDRSQGQGIDLLLREALFKRIRPIIEEIERGG